MQPEPEGPDGGPTCKDSLKKGFLGAPDDYANA